MSYGVLHSRAALHTEAPDMRTPMRLSIHADLEINLTKKCSTCHEEKPLNEFSKSATEKFGRRSKCKVCTNAYKKMKAAEYIAANELLNMIEIWERTPEKKCCMCKEVLPSTEFGRSNGEKSGLNDRCRSCVSEYVSQYRKDNPEKARGWSAKRRAKKLDLFLDDFSYDEIIKRDGAEACAYCHTTEGPFDVDHVFPLNLDGWHTPDNLVLACASHNRSKGAVHPALYIAREGFTPNRAVLRALAMERELICLSIKEDALCA